MANIQKQDMEIANRTEHDQGEDAFVAIFQPREYRIRKRNPDKIGKMT